MIIIIIVIFIINIVISFWKKYRLNVKLKMSESCSSTFLSFFRVEIFGPQPGQALDGPVSVKVSLLLLASLVELRRWQPSYQRNQPCNVTGILHPDYAERHVEWRKWRHESVSGAFAGPCSLRVLNAITLCIRNQFFKTIIDSIQMH